ncbi:MAG: Holliday junction resolvase RecU [Bacilli bacterium]|nr:Holliday junction resolvase RecU [Bacilli bacterium]
MIRYPNGMTYYGNKKRKKHLTSTELSISSANRGMELEHLINQSNEYYQLKHICLVKKRPVPINVLKVDYTKGARITQAFFEEKSTTDYNGLYKSKYLDFEAKSTQNSTAFPLNNITKHQIEHLKEVILQNGIAFFIIQFKAHEKIFFVEAKDVIDFISKNNRKSIPYDFFVKNCEEIKLTYNPYLDYIKIVDKKYF